VSAVSRLLAVADALPVTVLAAIAGAGSFTHIRDTAAQHGQTGPMSWAVAVCVDLTCVMAARERQRDKQQGVTARRLSWPAVVLAGGVLLRLFFLVGHFSRNLATHSSREPGQCCPGLNEGDQFPVLVPIIWSVSVIVVSKAVGCQSLLR
jgi:Protein of unknown function (DUF2637)